MSKQIKDLLTENKQLKTEIKALATEHQKIKQQLQLLENNIDQKIAIAIKKTTQTLTEQINQLQTQNTQKDQEILHLKTQLNKNSTNSSKPPSTNNPYKKTIHNNREKTNRKTGAQPGHKGTTLTIPKNLDELVKEGKAKHNIVDQTNGTEKYITKWTVDLEITIVYTEYRLPYPNTPTISYGNNIKALTVLLTNNGLIAEDRLSDFFYDISNQQITMSGATIEKFNHTAAQNVDIEEIKQDLLNGEVLHVDETISCCVERLEYDQMTPLIAEKTSFNVFVRTYSGATSTLLMVCPHKDDEGVVRDGVLESFGGILAHDHDAKYYKYSELHATCGAHLSRDLKGLFESYNILWADKFRRFYVGLNMYKECDVEMGCVCASYVRLLGFEGEYDGLLVEGESVLEGLHPKGLAFKELKCMLRRLRVFRNSYLLFLWDYRAPFTNNLAERDLRHCKTKLKVSGCFRSWRGLECYARIRSFLSTETKRGHPLLPAVKTLFTKTPITR